VPDAKPSILVVDDEPEILFSLQALLRREFDVHTATGGAEALEVLRRHPVSVIMTDQRMPGMTGAELLAQAKDVSPAATRVIFTGYADLRAVIEAVNRGEVFRYLTKPWDPDELCDVLREACARAAAEAERDRLLVEARAYLAGDAAAAELVARLDRVLEGRGR
jgi:DNA-binding NtrC family response regulator